MKSNKSKIMEERWKKEEYRKQMQVSFSEAWKKPRKKSKKEPYYNKIKELLTNEGYSLITSLEEYLYGDAYLKTLCPNKHEFLVTYKEWIRKNKRCPVCKNEKKEKRLKNVAEKKNFNIEKIDKGDIIFICENGHRNKITLSNFYKKQNCGKCGSNASLIEKEIRDILEKNYIHFECNRKIIQDVNGISRELDIYIPEKNIAIEYNGFPFHFENFGNKDKKYHLNKTIECEKKNIQLLHIFADEWEYKKELVINKILHLLHHSNKSTLYARKCEIREINHIMAKSFCDEYHIQNYSPSKIKLGAFYKNTLIAVMTFSKPNISKGGKNKENIWELNRFCSSTHVIGIAGKLLKYFEKNYIWKEIFSYADRRWSIGNVYNQIGFTFNSLTPPNYWYVNLKKHGQRRFHRFYFRKNLLEGEGTEWEIMQQNGWDRIWDCGNLKFIKNK